MNNIYEERLVMCKECQAEFEVNRLGQTFCSRRCRNRFNNRRHKISKEGTIAVDKILHRNRAVLAERVGEETSINELEVAGFNFSYFTSIVKRDGVKYHFCYEYAYQFITQEKVKIFEIPKNN